MNINKSDKKNLIFQFKFLYFSQKLIKKNVKKLKMKTILIKSNRNQFNLIHSQKVYMIDSKTFPT